MIITTIIEMFMSVAIVLNHELSFMKLGIFMPLPLGARGIIFQVVHLSVRPSVWSTITQVTDQLSNRERPKPLIKHKED